MKKEGLIIKTCIIILNLRHSVFTHFCQYVSTDNKVMRSRIHYVHADFKIFTHVITKKKQTITINILVLTGIFHKITPIEFQRVIWRKFQVTFSNLSFEVVKLNEGLTLFSFGV